MKRDMELLREILLYCEEKRPPGDAISISDTDFLDRDRDTLRAHVELLREQGWVEITSTKNSLAIRRITYDGCDFLDAVRDPEIWKQTKEGATAAGGFTLDLLKSLAKGYVRKKISDQTGIEL